MTFVLSCSVATPRDAQDFSWFRTQDLILTVPREPYETLGIKFGPAMGKASALPPAPLLARGNAILITVRIFLTQGPER